MPRQKETTTRRSSPAPTATLKALHDVAEAARSSLGMAAPLGRAQIAWMTHLLELAAELGAGFSGDLMAFTACPGTAPSVCRARSDPAARRRHAFLRSGGKDSPPGTSSGMVSLLTRNVQDALNDTPALSGKERRRAAFWWRQWLNGHGGRRFPAHQSGRHGEGRRRTKRREPGARHAQLPRDLRAGNRMTRRRRITVARTR
ncbi:MAG: hypothetical protein M5R42_08830 [Rhodocyclaceae bacterium]|nr:hypothetical protein [Rhodocyclaceae bacterium]